jgi:hypothetical protein
MKLEFVNENCRVCHNKITYNVEHWRSTGINIPSAECRCQLKMRKLIVTTKPIGNLSTQN